MHRDSRMNGDSQGMGRGGRGGQCLMSFSLGKGESSVDEW